MATSIIHILVSCFAIFNELQVANCGQFPEGGLGLVGTTEEPNIPPSLSTILPFENPACQPREWPGNEWELSVRLSYNSMINFLYCKQGLTLQEISPSDCGNNWNSSWSGPSVRCVPNVSPVADSTTQGVPQHQIDGETSSTLVSPVADSTTQGVPQHQIDGETSSTLGCLQLPVPPGDDLLVFVDIFAELHVVLIEYYCDVGFTLRLSSEVSCDSVALYCVPNECLQLPEFPENGWLTPSQNYMHIEYHCREGFTLEGPTLSYCEPTRNPPWLNETVYCIPNACLQSPEPPENGGLSRSPDFIHVEYYCNESFTLMGPSYSFCDPTSQPVWSFAGFCVPNACLQSPEPPENGGLSRSPDFIHVEYYCNGSFTLMGPSDSFCDPTSQPVWSFAGFCVPNACLEPPEPPANGGLSRSDDFIHVEYYCNLSFTLIGTPYSLCDPTRQPYWSVATGICVPDACVQLPVPPENGGLFPSHDYTHVEYYCNESFTLIGPSNSSCNTTRHSAWSSAGICVPNACLEPPEPPANGGLSRSDDFIHVEYYCNLSFTLIGTPYSLCDPTRQPYWSVATGICVPDACVQLPVPPENGGLFPSHDYTHVEYYCNESFTLIGPSNSSCNTTRHSAWSSAGICVPNACLEPPEPPANGGLSRSDDFIHVEYYCNLSFTLIGTPYSLCDPTRQPYWSVATGICVPDACVQLPVPPENGGLFPSHDYTHVEYYCNESFTLIGPSNSSCNTTRHSAWSSAGICVPNECVQLPEFPENGWLTLSQNYMHIEYHCREGFTLEGPTLSYCEPTRNPPWLNETVYCIPNACLEPPEPPANGGLSRSDDFIHVEYYCNLGFTLIGTPYSLCDPTRQPYWSVATGICVPDACVQLPVPPENGGLFPSHDYTHVEYYCNESFTLIGPSNSSCNTTRHSAWSSAGICVPNECVQLPEFPENGWLTLSQNYMHIEYHCREGFTLEGPTLSYCEPTRNPPWLNETVYCIPNACLQPPEPPENGGLSRSPDFIHVEYYCNEGFTLMGPSNSFCDPTSQPVWSFAGFCVPNACLQPPEPPENGGLSRSPDFIHVEYYCNGSFTLMGPSDSFCDPTSQPVWSFAGFCVPNACLEPPEPPANGGLSRSDDFIHVEYYCNLGFTLIGTPYSLCDPTRQPYWSVATGICVPDACVQLPVPPENGGLFPSHDYTHVEYYCNESFTLIGPSNSSCNTTRHSAWSSAGICVPNACLQPPEPPVNGGLSRSADFIHVDYYCHEGFMLNGTSNSFCDPTRQPVWSLAGICFPIECGEPKSPKHGGVFYNSSGYNGRASYYCNVGYTISDGGNSICLAAGHWSNTEPECTPVVCPSLGNQTDGYVEFVNGSTVFEALAVYHCFTGYSLVGAEARECQDDGNWSGAQPYCERERNDSKPCSKTTDTRGNLWHEAHPGRVVVRQCQTMDSNLTGTFSRNCTLSGLWQEPMYACLNKFIANGLREVDALLENPTNTSTGTALSLLSNLTQDQELYEEEITKSVDILERIVDASQNVTETQSEDFFDITDSLLDKRNKDSWSLLSQSSDEQRTQSAFKMLYLVDDYVDRIATSLTDEEHNRTIPRRNIVGFAAKVEEDAQTDVVFPPSVGTIDDDSTKLVMSKDSLNGSSAYAALLYKDLKGILNTEISSNDTGNVDVNSAVLGFVLATSRRSNLTKPIVLTFKHLKGDHISPKCSFLNIERNVWDTDGCYLRSTSDDVTVCECNHLTNFAVLMSPWVKESVDELAINIISYIGCSLSAIGLILTVGMHIFLWRYVKADRVYILINLCIALVISYIVFLSGVKQTGNENACTAIAILLQYFYLVVFFMMLAEGIEIAVTVLYVFPTKSRLKWMLPLAWGLPAVIVGISMGATKLKGYGTDQFCWLSVENSLVWSFVAPACIVILVNLVLLILVMRKMFQTKAMATSSRKNKVKNGARCLCVLLPLMGCSWILGVFYVSEGMIWVQYVFALCNSLQGVVIFIFHVLFNEKMKAALKSRKRRLSDSVLTSNSSTLTTATERVLAKEKRDSMVCLIGYRFKPDAEVY